jgi:hypothetical protein
LTGIVCRLIDLVHRTEYSHAPPRPESVTNNAWPRSFGSNLMNHLDRGATGNRQPATGNPHGRR